MYMNACVCVCVCAECISHQRPSTAHALLMLMTRIISHACVCMYVHVTVYFACVQFRRSAAKRRAPSPLVQPQTIPTTTPHTQGEGGVPIPKVEVGVAEDAHAKEDVTERGRTKSASELKLPPIKSTTHDQVHHRYYTQLHSKSAHQYLDPAKDWEKLSIHNCTVRVPFKYLDPA